MEPNIAELKKTLFLRAGVIHQDLCKEFALSSLAVGLHGRSQERYMEFH